MFLQEKPFFKIFTLQILLLENYLPRKIHGSFATFSGMTRAVTCETYPVCFRPHRARKMLRPADTTVKRVKPASESGRWGLLGGREPIVGGFTGDDHVVRMAFTQGGRSHAKESRLCAQLLNGSRTTVAHPGSQPSHELEDMSRKTSLVRNSTFNPLGNHLPLIRNVNLAVPIPAAFFHRA